MFVIISGCGDRTGHMCSVTVTVHWVIVVVGKIPAVNIVYESISVVIFAVTSNFSWVFPDVALEVRVIVVDSGVNDCNDNAGRALGDFPCLACLHLWKSPLGF